MANQKTNKLNPGMYDPNMVQGAVGLAEAIKAHGDITREDVAQHKTFPKFAGLIVQAWAQGKDPVQAITDYINKKNAKRGDN